MKPATFAPDDHPGQAEHFLSILKRYIAPRGVVHVGAHKGEEVEVYRRHGCTRIVLIEANPKWCEWLQHTFADSGDVEVYNYAVGSHDGRATLHIHTSRTGSTEPASVLPLARFKEIVPTLQTEASLDVPAIRLDTFFRRHDLDAHEFDLVNLDIQGAELLALEGAAEVLQVIGAVLTEVHFVDLYEGGAAAEKIDAFLEGLGFERIAALVHDMYDSDTTFSAWGETLFVRAGTNER
jgi:methyltransferase, FkbM family